MAECRLFGDRVYEKQRNGWVLLDVPAPLPQAREAHASTRRAGTSAASVQESVPADSERRRLSIEWTPVGPLIVHPADYVRRLPAYESAAIQVHGLPIRRVWEIVHASTLRAAIVQEADAPAAFTIVINSLRTPCVVHRVASFEHELEHARRGDTRKASTAIDLVESERRCEAVGDSAALVAARMAASRLQESSSHVRVDVDRCRTCNRNSEAPCAQGADVFHAVNAALPGM